jgi:hypothetical protein
MLKYDRTASALYNLCYGQDIKSVRVTYFIAIREIFNITPFQAVIN